MQTPEIRRNPVTGVYEQVTVVPFDADQARADLADAQERLESVDADVETYTATLNEAVARQEALRETVAFHQAVVSQLDESGVVDTTDLDVVSGQPTESELNAVLDELFESHAEALAESDDEPEATIDAPADSEVQAVPIRRRAHV